MKIISVCCKIYYSYVRYLTFDKYIIQTIAHFYTRDWFNTGKIWKSVFVPLFASF